MAEVPANFMNTKQSFIEETVRGTAEAETAASAFVLSSEGNDYNLEREINEDPSITGSFSKSPGIPGMYSEDIGPTAQTPLRGYVNGVSEPAWSVLMKSIFGLQEENTDGVCDLGCTTDVIQVKSGAGDLTPGQLLYFPTQDEVRAVVTEAAGEIQLDIPLSSTPAEDDDFIAGINWMLSSSGHITFTSYSHFEGPKRLVYAGCLCTQMNLGIEVGKLSLLTFINKGFREPTEDYTAQVVTPTLDTETRPMTCLGVQTFTRYEGTATGTPTTTETILLAPNYEVAIGDKIQIDVGAGVFETVAISAVSGNAGSNITLTHAAVSVAASAADTVYVVRVNCSDNYGDTMEIVVEMDSETEKCISATSGFTDRSFTGRTVTFTPTPYFLSWQNLYLRDTVTGSAMQMIFSDETAGGDNLFCIQIRNKIITEYGLTTDLKMRENVTMQAALDSVMGNDHEIVMAMFQIPSA
jgi:hypothetical protein